MSAQVTEKHIDLVRCVLDAEWWGSNVEKRFAQLIADSEAKAVAEWQDFVHLKGEAIDSLLLECGRLRAELATERARLDYMSNCGFEHLHNETGDHLGHEWTISSYGGSRDVTLRDVIDAEMKEETK